jgi:hypothetical protein
MKRSTLAIVTLLTALSTATIAPAFAEDQAPAADTSDSSAPAPASSDNTDDSAKSGS